LKRIPEYEHLKVEYCGGKPRIDFYDKKEQQLDSVDISYLKDEEKIDDKLIEFGINYNKTYFREDMRMQEEEFAAQADEYHPPNEEPETTKEKNQDTAQETTDEYTPFNSGEYQDPEEEDDDDEEGFGQFNNQMFFGGGGGFDFNDDGGGG
jgi:hypothetical protein